MFVSKLENCASKLSVNICLSTPLNKVFLSNILAGMLKPRFSTKASHPDCELMLNTGFSLFSVIFIGFFAVFGVFTCFSAIFSCFSGVFVNSGVFFSEDEILSGMPAYAKASFQVQFAHSVPWVAPYCR